MFKFGKCIEESLPLNSNILHQHILQANLYILYLHAESYICKHAAIPILATPPLVGYGWKLEEGLLKIVHYRCSGHKLAWNALNCASVIVLKTNMT